MTRAFVATPSASVAYQEWGTGRPALLIHGALINGTQYREVAEVVASEDRRCLAPDLMGHGHTRMAEDQPLGMDAQAEMLRELLDALSIGEVDLVGSDSGGGVAQVFAVSHPDRVRSLALTNCDVYDNNPPEAFAPFMRELRRRGTCQLLTDLLSDPELARSRDFMGSAVEEPSHLTDELLREYIAPLVATDESVRAIERYLYANDGRHTVAISESLRSLDVPTAVIWGTGDPFFDVRWAHWLANTLPDVRRLEILEGARLYMHHDRPEQLGRILEEHWADAERA